jgi:DNA-binding response OmpR family regulator
MDGGRPEPVMERPLRVLVAAGSGVDLWDVPAYLADQGCLVARSAGDEAASRVITLRPDLVVAAEQGLLDLLSLCRDLRAATWAPLLVLGQRDVEEDEVLCLEYGADGYLAANASPRRVRAHIQALLRRGHGDPRIEAEASLRFGAIRIDHARHRVYRGDAELDLSQKEYTLLLFLVEHTGQALAEFVWGPGAVSENRSLDVHIHWLREKLEADASNPRFIRTVRGVGYCFDPTYAAEHPAGLPTGG